MIHLTMATQRTEEVNPGVRLVNQHCINLRHHHMVTIAIIVTDMHKSIHINHQPTSCCFSFPNIDTTDSCRKKETNLPSTSTSLEKCEAPKSSIYASCNNQNKRINIRLRLHMEDHPTDRNWFTILSHVYVLLAPDWPLAPRLGLCHNTFPSIIGLYPHKRCPAYDFLDIRVILGLEPSYDYPIILPLLSHTINGVQYGYQPAPSHITTILIILGLLKNMGNPPIKLDLAFKPMVTWGSPILRTPQKDQPVHRPFSPQKRHAPCAWKFPAPIISVMSGHVRVSSGGCPRPAL